MRKKPLVVLFLGGGWEPWDETYLEKEGIGGSETAAIWMARELAEIGYEVKVFAHPFKEHFDEKGFGVEYLHYTNWQSFAEKQFIDVLICSRTLYPLQSFVQAAKKYV